MKVSDAIDWTPHDKYPELILECRCGAVYKSHAKAAIVGRFARARRVQRAGRRQLYDRLAMNTPSA